MMPSRVAVIRRGLEFSDLIAAQAEAHRLDPWIVFAVCCQESACNPAALRPEPGFWLRYGANVLRAIAASATRTDDRWAAYPEIASASYGLMQVMYPVALEVGLVLAYPTELCVPAIGLEAGCRKLAQCFDRVPTIGSGLVTIQPIEMALQWYNGGGNKLYPSLVRSWSDDAMRSGLLPTGWGVRATPTVTPS